MGQNELPWADLSELGRLAPKERGVHFVVLLWVDNDVAA
jgi:hypothetical protein